MEQKDFQFVRLVGDERRVGTTLQEVSKHWQGKNESAMFISPHDDDAVLGAGLHIQLAQREKAPVYIIIVTDGSMGYCTDEEKQKITEVRRQEAFQCYESLGVPKDNIIWLGFADCQINSYRGRRQAEPDSNIAIEGFEGLQNSFTYYLRKFKPTQCFIPTCNDLHPDHRIIYDEFLISMFHASGEIWPELGGPLKKIPHVHETAVYCDFSGPPTLRVRVPNSYLENKIKAIEAFKSQKQISSLVESVKNAGPEEYIRAIDFKLYDSRFYHDMFEPRRTIRRMP